MFLKKTLAVAAVTGGLLAASLLGSSTAHATITASGVAGDVNGDGFGDLFATTSAGGVNTYKYVAATTTAPNGSYSNATAIVSGSGTGDWNWASKIPDVNGDGFDDILARRTSDSSLRLYVSNNTTTSTTSTGVTYTYSKQVGQNWGGIKLLTVLNQDVSGDGTPDIVALGSNNELFRYSWKKIENQDGTDGSGFGDQTQIGQNWGQIRELTSLESSKGPSLVAVGNDGSLINYWFDTQTGSSTKGMIIGQQTTSTKLTASAVTGDYPTMISAGDTDGDGLGDLIVRPDAGNSLILYKARVNGQWISPKTIAFSGLTAASFPILF